MVKKMIMLSDVSKVYDGNNVETSVNALKNVDLTIEDGEFVSIMGKSGSGKSTLLNVIGTLIKPSDGKVFIDGMDIFRMKSRQISDFRNKKMGYVYQNFMLENALTALENVEIPLLISGAKSRESREKACEMLEKVGLGERLHHYPTRLSGGEKQRVCIARALINNPEILLADEPTGNLDMKTGNEIFELITKMTCGKTFILVTHDSELASKAKRKIIINDGMVSEYEG